LEGKVYLILDNLCSPGTGPRLDFDCQSQVQTSTNPSSEEVARAYKNLWMIEHAFRDIRSCGKIIS